MTTSDKKILLIIIFGLILLFTSGVIVELKVKTDVLDNVLTINDFISLLKQVIAILIGVITSLAAWFVLFHLITPKVVFSSKISKTKVESYANGYSYRIKLWNIGKRDIIDLDVFIRLKIKGLTSKENLWHTIDFNKRFDKIIYFGKEENRIIPFYPNKTGRFSENIFPKTIRDKVENGILTLEDVLGLGSKSFVRVYIFGFDKFSGSRKIFLSRKYFLNDIEEANFIHIERDEKIYTSKN